MDGKTYCLDCIHKEVCGWYPREGCDRLVSVDVLERKVGKWIFWEKDRVMCPFCKLEPYAGKGAAKFNYCPFCGADLREEDKN